MELTERDRQIDGQTNMTTYLVRVSDPLPKHDELDKKVLNILLHFEGILFKVTIFQKKSGS